MEQWNCVVEERRSVEQCGETLEKYGGTEEQCGQTVWNNMVEQCRTVCWNSGTVWWDSVVEQCEGTVWNSMEQYGGTVEQCGGTAWNSIMEQGDSTVLNIIVEV